MTPRKHEENISIVQGNLFQVLQPYYWILFLRKFNIVVMFSKSECCEFLKTVGFQILILIWIKDQGICLISLFRNLILKVFGKEKSAFTCKCMDNYLKFSLI